MQYIIKNIFFIFLLGTAQFSHAQNWTGNTNNDWNNPANWTGWPLTGDDLVIDPVNYTGASASPVISANSVFTPAGLLVQNGASITINANLTCNDRVEITGAGTNVVFNSGTLNAAGGGSNGRFILSDGANMNMNGGTLLANQRVIVELGAAFTMNNGNISTGEIAVGDGNATASSSFTMNNGTINIDAMGFENEAGVFYPGFYMNAGTLNIGTGGMSWLGVAPGAGTAHFIMNGGTTTVLGDIINDPASTVDLYLELSGNSVFNFNSSLIDLTRMSDSIVMHDMATLNLSNTVNLNNTGVLYATGGTTVANGNTGLAGTGTYTFYNVQINAAKTLSHLTSTTVRINGNFTNNGTFNANAHPVLFSGTNMQYIGGTSTTAFHLFILNNAAGLTLNQAINIQGHLLLSNGKLSTSAANILTITDNATSSAGSGLSFVNGPMKKTGNDAFVFPIGKNNSWRRMGISAPVSVTSEFTAEYFDTAYSSTSPVLSPLTVVSPLEHWTLNASDPADEVLVKLHWENAALSAITDCAELSMAYWIGSAWQNVLSTSTGTCTSSGTGSLQSDTTVPASVFTFGFYDDVTVQSFSICYGDSIIVDTNTYNAPGTYTNVFTAADMSDSVVITQLQVSQPINVIQSGITLSANDIDGAVYTWLDCNNSFSVVAGETAPVFTTTANGSYAVMVNQGDCIDTSACFVVNTVNVFENAEQEEVKVYPNPNNGEVNLEGATGSYMLRDATGKVLLQGNIFQSKTLLNFTASPRGIYFLELTTEQGSKVVKLVKI